MSVNKPMLSLPCGCIEAEFVRRVKRFSMEFALSGKSIWAHANNTGAMTGLLKPGCRALLSPALKPGRKLPWTVERMWVDKDGGFWAGVNTTVPNRLLYRAFELRMLDFMKGYTSLRREATHGQSRLDARLDAPDRPTLWIECKNVTLVRSQVAAFPDAKSERAQKHMRELAHIRKSGQEAALFLLVQRPDAISFAPAVDIDPVYGRLFYEAMAMGVNIQAWEAEILSTGITLGRQLPVQLP